MADDSAFYPTVPRSATRDPRPPEPQTRSRVAGCGPRHARSRPRVPRSRVVSLRDDQEAVAPLPDVGEADDAVRAEDEGRLDLPVSAMEREFDRRGTVRAVGRHVQKLDARLGARPLECYPCGLRRGVVDFVGVFLIRSIAASTRSVIMSSLMLSVVRSWAFRAVRNSLN